ncbi:putative membrane protein [Aquimarina intermedia]|uniref:Putative membrane protein n=2 Tax=Aquimarina intermedia TaxID=350814 RepID=A0A5S5CC26_9FLAO|nr:putative membrane protein [Aquimarina intermedia]
MLIEPLISYKLIISIFFVWLFNITGILGIVLGYETWFLTLTPLTLSLNLLLLIINHKEMSLLLLTMLIPFGLGMISELLGVNFGLIFGDYAYGNNLGAKLYGVPWIIGVNWATLTYCTAAIARKMTQKLIPASLIGASLMVVLDLVIEQSAPRFDFWEFRNGVVPLQNYIGWFGVALLAHIFFQRIIRSYSYTIAIHTYVAMAIFFLTFLFL